MLTYIDFSKFNGVPYLNTSALAKAHTARVAFSTKKPNVVVGPNGTGKSALLKTLALLSLAWLTGRSTLDEKYLGQLERDADGLWSKEREWGNDWEWLKGLDSDTDYSPALFYRPGHIPGNEASIAHAIMCGYSKEARAYGKLTEDKSSGQQAQAVMEHILETLRSESPTVRMGTGESWRAGTAPKKIDSSRWVGPWEYMAEALKKRYLTNPGNYPLVLMDEPEQSLDSLAELKLWKAIEQADCTKVQIIVATHSLYPLLKPEAFNILEAEEGYIEKVLALV